MKYLKGCLAFTILIGMVGAFAFSVAVAVAWAWSLFN
jgi:hypothetical protein